VALRLVHNERAQLRPGAGTLLQAWRSFDQFEKVAIARPVVPDLFNLSTDFFKSKRQTASV